MSIGVHARELLCKWNRVMQDLGRMFYSICHTIELLEKGPSKKTNHMVDDLHSECGEVDIEEEGLDDVPEEVGPEEDGLDTEEEGPEDVPEEESPEREPLEDESSEEVPIFARHSEGSTRPRRNIQVPIRMIE